MSASDGRGSRGCSRPARSGDRSVWLCDGRRLSYAEYGTPDGKPVFLFHGIPARFLRHPDASIADGLHIQLIVPEQPGMGMSDSQRRRTLLDWPADVRGVNRTHAGRTCSRWSASPVKRRRPPKTCIWCVRRCLTVKEARRSLWHPDSGRSIPWMLRTRLFEEAVTTLWHDGLISGEMHLGTGEEAIIAGVVSQLRKGDAMALDHRGTAALLLRGVDPLLILRELLGQANGLCGRMGGHMHLFSREHLAASSGIVGAVGPAASRVCAWLRSISALIPLRWPSSAKGP